MIASLRTRAKPDFASADEAAVYAFACELWDTREVSESTWQRATAIFGLRGVIELIGILGYYALISMTIKACRIEPGAEGPHPFAPAGD